MAFITAFTADMNCMDTDVYKEYSCKVNAVVDLYGVSCVKIREDFPTTPNQGEPDSPEGLEIGSKNVYGHPYFWSEPTLSLIEQFFKKHMK